MAARFLRDGSPALGYDEEDRRTAATRLQSLWKGYSWRNRLWAAMKIQAIARGRAGRAAVAVERVKRKEKEEANKERQKQKRARANRLQRLELDAKLLDRTDIESFNRFMEKRRERAAIKVQKCWRLKVAQRRMAEEGVYGFEASPEMEAAARVIQRAAQHYINKKRRRWRPATLHLDTGRRMVLEHQIRDYIKKPFKDPAWANNSKWLAEEAMTKFHEYRCVRSDQAFAAAERSCARRAIDRQMLQLERLSSLKDLTTLAETFKMGVMGPPPGTTA